MVLKFLFSTNYYFIKDPFFKSSFFTSLFIPSFFATWIWFNYDWKPSFLGLPRLFSRDTFLFETFFLGHPLLYQISFFLETLHFSETLIIFQKLRLYLTLLGTFIFGDRFIGVPFFNGTFFPRLLHFKISSFSDHLV